MRSGVVVTRLPNPKERTYSRCPTGCSDASDGQGVSSSPSRVMARNRSPVGLEPPDDDPAAAAVATELPP